VRYAEQEYAEVAEITQRAQRKAGGEGEKRRRGEQGIRDMWRHGALRDGSAGNYS
jgi:hypothetical protein